MIFPRNEIDWKIILEIDNGKKIQSEKIAV
jgi:hypothetical protein